MNDDNDEMMFSKKYLLGSFAHWAINQSPYYVPDNLEKVLRQLADLLPTHEFDGGYGFKTMTRDEFRTWFMSVITQIPDVVQWNEPKSKHKAPHIFVSRYRHPLPDDDIIDLSALVSNVCRELYKNSKEV